jgi:phage terminase large subunit-like protein
MEKWAACGFNEEPIAWRQRMLELLRGAKCKGALDLGSTSDFTALALSFEHELALPATYILLPFFWLPEESSNKREAALREGYKVWVHQGFVKYTSGDTTDYDVVRADVNELGDRFAIEEIAVDRLFQGAQVCNQLMGDGFTISAHGQGFLSMARPTRQMEELYLQARIHHGNNPVLTWMASNTDVLTDPAGNMKPNKPDNENPFKIDGIVASIMSLGLMTVAPAKRSKYETQELARM